MKIELEYPYSSKWKFGYLVINPENRKTVILFNTSKDRSSVSYARYLMSVKLGRLLSTNEHVDHKDDDKTNDVLSNLQILTPAENNKKSARGLSVVQLQCQCCKTDFVRENRLMHSPRKTISCSRKCSSNLQFNKCQGN